MENFIENINIENFRNIRNLKLDNLNKINLILGGNDVGKTSLLEVIYMLKNPSNFNVLLKTTKMRMTKDKEISVYDSFINFFPKDNKQIMFSANGKNYKCIVSITGEEVDSEVKIEDLALYSLVELRALKLDEIKQTKTFIGKMKVLINDKKTILPIRYSILTRFKNNDEGTKLKINYLSPIDHLTGSVYDKILNNESYKSLCIEMARFFDPDLEDFLYLKDSYTGKAIEYIKNSKKGLISLSSYGDGLKKFLSIANALLDSMDGILLIDEIETSIHYSHYEKVFSFIINTALKLNIQLFITSHNKEVIEQIIGIQNYRENYDINNDILNVITLKKVSDNHTKCRSLKGCECYKNLSFFDFEVR